MSVRRARILRGADADAASRITFPEPAPNTRVVPAVVFAAREEAARIVDDARAFAAQSREAIREEELAKLVATHLALGRTRTPATSEENVDAWIDLAKLLAERLLAEELSLDPAKIRALAASVLETARGSKQGMLSSHPADAPSLRALLSELGLTTIAVREDDQLRRGSILLHTDVGEVDGRIETQLERLGVALREAIVRKP